MKGYAQVLFTILVVGLGGCAARQPVYVDEIRPVESSTGKIAAECRGRWVRVGERGERLVCEPYLAEPPYVGPGPVPIFGGPWMAPPMYYRPYGWRRPYGSRFWFGVRF